LPKFATVISRRLAGSLSGGEMKREREIFEPFSSLGFHLFISIQPKEKESFPGIKISIPDDKIE